MNWRRGLIRLWIVASVLYVGLSVLIGGTLYDVIVPPAVAWALLYSGIWIARGFQGEKKQ